MKAQHVQGVAPAAPGTSASGAVYAVRPGVRLAAAVMVPFWTVLPGMGLIDLQVMFVPDSYYADTVGLMVSWGVLMTFLVALPFAWVAVRPEQALPVVVLLGLCAGSVLLGAVLGLQWQPAVVAALIVVTALPLLPVALRQARYEGLRLRVRPTLLVLAVVVAPFAYGYASEAFGTARSDPSPEPWRTNGVDHWPVQGSLGIAVVIILLVLAVWPRAVPVARAVLALALATMALCWAVSPDTVGSVDSVPLTAGTLLVAVLVALTPHVDEASASLPALAADR